MFKSLLIGLVLIFSLHVNVFAEVSKTDDDAKVEKAFNQMKRAYRGEDLKSFFRNVSENKFQKDFLEFFDDVQEDLQKHDILSLDIWVDKITTDKKARFLYVTWSKRYISTQSNIEINKDGKSMFLFVKTKKRYKLVDYGGDVLFGDTE